MFDNDELFNIDNMNEYIFNYIKDNYFQSYDKLTEDVKDCHNYDDIFNMIHRFLKYYIPDIKLYYNFTNHYIKSIPSDAEWYSYSNIIYTNKNLKMDLYVCSEPVHGVAIVIKFYSLEPQKLHNFYIKMLLHKNDEYNINYKIINMIDKESENEEYNKHESFDDVYINMVGQNEFHDYLHKVIYEFTNNEDIEYIFNVEIIDKLFRDLKLNSLDKLKESVDYIDPHIYLDYLMTQNNDVINKVLYKKIISEEILLKFIDITNETKKEFNNIHNLNDSFHKMLEDRYKMEISSIEEIHKLNIELNKLNHESEINKLIDKNHKWKFGFNILIVIMLIILLF